MTASTAPFPARILALLHEVADRKGTDFRGPFEDGDGEPLQDDADAAILWVGAALPAPVDHIAEADKMMSQWVSVDERLPKPDVFVLAVMRSKRKGGKSSTVVAAIDSSDGTWFLFGGSDVQGPITHYMPLPAPPAAQGGKP